MESILWQFINLVFCYNGDANRGTRDLGEIYMLVTFTQHDRLR